jgi:hypothetical protein
MTPRALGLCRSGCQRRAAGDQQVAMMSNGEIYQSGSNTMINDNHGDTVTLAGIQRATLGANNFHFS